MATRCNIIIKRGDEEILIYRHWDGKPAITGTELLKICKESGYDIFGIIRTLSKSGDYELSRYKHGDAEYEYTIDLDKKDIEAYHISDKTWISSEDFDLIDPLMQ